MENKKETLFCDKMSPEILKDIYEQNGASAIVIGIPYQYIKENNFAYVESFVTAIEGFEHGKEHGFILSTNAYDTDSRELFEIPEWVEYLDRLVRKVPRLFYHLEAPSKLLIIQCLCSSKAVRLDGETINHSIDNKKLYDLLGVVGDCLTAEESEEVLSDLNLILKRK